MIRLNEQYLGSVLSVKSGLLTWHTKTGYYEIQALNSEHVVSCAKIIQLLKHRESALKSHRRGSKHKELAAFKIAQRSAPISQYMSFNVTVASPSSSDKPGPLMSCGLDFSPSVRDASAETPSLSASLKEMLV